jgi:cystathionine beta-synthase
MPSHPPLQPHSMRNARPYDSVLDTIGWTPLIRLNRVTRGIRTPVYGKA